jgi:uncharacterized protein (TIGR00288 family)
LERFQRPWRGNVNYLFLHRNAPLTVTIPAEETQVAVLVDCDNTSPAVLAYALRVVARLGRVVVRRGYGNHTTLSNKWQGALVEHAFTPCLQFQYANGKNTADIALALDAQELLFDARADTFCIVTSDSDFAYLCRKLRERGATVCIVGEAKTPMALRNATDQFFEWVPVPPVTGPDISIALPAVQPKDASRAVVAKTPPKQRPRRIVEAVEMLSSDTPEGKVNLGTLGQYLKRTDPGFSPGTYGHSGLLSMVSTYDLLKLTKEPGGHYTVSLSRGSPEHGTSPPPN